MSIFRKTVKPMAQLQLSDMGTASKAGLMEHIMKAIGSIIKPMGKAYFGMRKEICIEEILKMIWQMATVNTRILTAQNIRESLLMISKKVMGKKNGMMEPSTLELTKMV